MYLLPQYSLFSPGVFLLINCNFFVVLNNNFPCELLVPNHAPPQEADRGRLTRYGGYRGNKIPGAGKIRLVLHVKGFGSGPALHSEENNGKILKFLMKSLGNNSLTKDDGN